ncbi:MAG: hypothetical protein HYZ43_07585 [Flavobacteriia bacterium]|nr:hypothetical protein [Flavobacteriia bacterium]
MRRLLLFTLVSSSLAALTFFLEKPNTYVDAEGVLIPEEWTAKNENPQTPHKYRRRVDQAILSVPEWYLVFSPNEQADYFAHTTATSFPYMRQNAQIWDIHKIVKDYTDTSRTKYKYNGEYQLMIYVINSSSSAEYVTKAWYERVVGRLTDTKTVETDEDKFTAQYTRDYVSFINDNFWYEFDFKDRLKKLWTETSFFDDHFLRKMERKYYLTSELIVKWGYGNLIKMSAESIHGPDDTHTMVLVKSLPQKQGKKYTVVESYPDKRVLLQLNRYARFNEEINRLAKDGLIVQEIAGNNTAIFVSLTVPSNKFFSTAYSENIFSQPIPSDPKKKRILLAVPVKDLNRLLLRAKEDGYEVEHVFDY